jgi:hypothetical protein
MTDTITTSPPDLTTEAIPTRRVLSDFTAKFGTNLSQLGDASTSRELTEGTGGIYSFLKEFATSDDLAEALRDSGIKGQRSFLETCPLANLFSQRVTDPEICRTIQVDNNGISFKIADKSFIIRSSVISEFVSRFDAGDFPFLEG